MESGRHSNVTLVLAQEPKDLIVGRGQSALLDCYVAARNEHGFLHSTVDKDKDDDGDGDGDEEQEQDEDGGRGRRGAYQFQTTWFQDGQPIVFPHARREILNNGSLYFSKASARQCFHKFNYYYYYLIDLDIDL